MYIYTYNRTCRNEQCYAVSQQPALRQGAQGLEGDAGLPARVRREQFRQGGAAQGGQGAHLLREAHQRR